MHRLPFPGWPAQAPLVRLVGRVRDARVEPAVDPARIDHVWIDVDAGLAEPIPVAVNTLSRLNLIRGLDPRMFVAEVREATAARPPVGATECAWFSHADFADRVPLVFEPWERADLERHLLQWCGAAEMIEVIGAPYHRRGVGVHQVHSRRASAAVRTDLRGQDGALRFFLPGAGALWLLQKFAGQP